jgi:hypothetical protein
MKEMIMNIPEKKAIDLLVNEFWRLGFFTISRRLGTYLPEPANVGEFKIDAVGRLKEKYAIGIVLNKEEIFNPELLEKISYLASRKSRSSNKLVTLFVGVEDEYFKRVKELLSSLDEKTRKNVKLIRIEENNLNTHQTTNRSRQIFFS